jgi:hypothetical protein
LHVCSPDRRRIHQQHQQESFVSLLPTLPPAILALADGTIFRGHAIGAGGSTSGEVVFNTAMSGYQEILTDPSYCRQIVTLTYPHIGNVGCNAEDFESRGNYAAGLVIRDLPIRAESWRLQETLPDYLQKHGVVAIAGIDTRKLTRILREGGAQAGCIMAIDVDDQKAIAEARNFPGLAGMDLAKVVSTSSPTSGQPANGRWTAIARSPRDNFMSWPTISASSTTSCACLPIAAAKSRSFRRKRRPPRSSSANPMAYFCPTVPATRNPATTPSRPSAKSSPPECRPSASASAISCWHWRPARGRRK